MEKTFTELDILRFIEKMRNILQADNILHQLNDPKKDINQCDNFKDALSKAYNIGYTQGSMHGRLDLLNTMFEHFYSLEK